MNELIKQAEAFFAKLPRWPAAFLDFLKKVFPYLLLISSVISIVFILAGMGIGVVATMVSPVHGTGFFITLVLEGLRAVLALMAGLMLVRGQYSQGFSFAFYSILVAVIISILDFNIPGLFGDFLYLWALFQLKPMYEGTSGGTDDSSFGQ